ncbi:hypothetical protein [Kitasatospora sp. NPDC051705]|uniref:hypothetical protein n=1 Tax=Kitasatospora sp. NPDC051705 TaxID=3364057 RepID=UPI003789B8CD
MTTTTAVRWRRRTVQGLVGGAVVLAALGLVGDRCSEDGGLLTPAELFHRPLLFGTLIAGALLAAVLIGVRDIVVRALTTVMAVLLGLLASPFYILAGDGTRTSMNEAAPGRDDRHLVVEEGSAMIDPLWWVYVDQGTGLTERRWRVGYFNGDAGTNALTGAAWDGPDHIRLTTGDTRTQVVELTASGRPTRTVTRGQ